MKKRIFAVILAAMLAFSGFAFAEEDLAAQLEKANARIAELEALVESYTVAAKFDGGTVTIDEVEEQYDYMVEMYSQYGYDLASYEDYYKEEILYQIAEYKIMLLKAEQLGLATFTEEEEQHLVEHAQEEYNATLEMYKAEFTGTDEEILQKAQNLLDSEGYTIDYIVNYQKEEAILSRIYEYATQDVALTDEMVRANYEELVETDKAAYEADVTLYEDAMMDGLANYYNPEGFRTVRHILLLFTDAETAELETLNAELEAAQTDADKAAVQAKIDAIHAGAVARTDVIYERLNAGEDFEVLLSEYNDDPGMDYGDPYYVSAESGMWVKEFAEGAMALENIGDVSEPVVSSYGIHIIKYVGDVTPGPVPFEEVEAELRETYMNELLDEAYNTAISEWIGEFHPEYHPERL